MSQSFDYVVIEKEAFSVVGIEVRTTNKDELEGRGKIGGQWQKFFSEGVLAKIPHKSDDAIISMYTKYESDVNGEYSFILGARVKEVSELPEGLISVEVPAAKYAKFTSRQGQSPDVIVELWQYVWGLAGKGEFERAYGADFDVHDERARDPENTQVDVFLSVR